jgi:triosephosphate isomerase
MYFSLKQAHTWVTHHKEVLKTLGNDFSIVICPSFEALSNIKKDLQETNIALGAQNCSVHKAGPYTGQVLAESLVQLGCTYCIVGHSEVRQAYNETDEIVAKKTIILLSQNITPLIYVGETAKEYDNQLIAQVLERQLNPVFEEISRNKITNKTIIIGYEPLWTKDTNNIPSTDYLIKQINFIKKLASTIIPEITCLVTYGGNVNEQTISSLKRIEGLDGVLIGKASTDFQSFEKIVLST